MKMSLMKDIRNSFIIFSDRTYEFRNMECLARCETFCLRFQLKITLGNMITDRLNNISGNCFSFLYAATIYVDCINPSERSIGDPVFAGAGNPGARIARTFAVARHHDTTSEELSVVGNINPKGTFP